MASWIDIGAVSDFPEGEVKVVPLEDTSVLVVRLADGFYAVENRCSHAEVPLANGVVQDAAIVCSRHGARFCLKTGQALSAPAYEPIATFPVQVVAGRVQLRDARWD